MFAYCGCDVRDDPDHVQAVQWAARKIRKGYALAELSQKEASIIQGVNESEHIKQLAGLSGHHVSFYRMLKLPNAFWDAFLPEFVARWGYRLEREDVTANAMGEMLEAAGRFSRLAMRMARVEPREENQKRRA